MAGKSQRRHLSRSKKRKVTQGFPITTAQRQATAQGYEPVSPALAPSVRAPAPRSTLPPVQHPYIATELRRIAILAGIMLAVLVVLYLVIP